ncbi:hypothetical protein AB0D94_27955 [Streptomyces sp. NPDC048255]|uniref:hypothetical protein n=1 Tax=Streptomyces sp. NPDC048255 TaxID=3154713 RepID=UPI003403C545
MTAKKQKKAPQKADKADQPKQSTKAPGKEAEDASPEARITAMDPAGPMFSGTNSR